MNRRDAIRIKDIDAFHGIVPFLMPKRTEAEVSITETFDITELEKYIKERNEKENANLKVFHCICAAVAKTLYLRPEMNNFISGKRFWHRKDITLSFVAKQKFQDMAEERLMFLTAKPEMTLDDISHKILGDVNQARKTSSNDIDKLMSTLVKLPRFLLSFIFFVVKRLEYHGIMPKALSDGDPNYSSVLLSNLGSIGAGAPYHHLSNYGTCSIMITIGTIRRNVEKIIEGKKELKDELDMTITLDERIADGFYFAKSLKVTKYLLAHPEVLAKPINDSLSQQEVSEITLAR